MTANYGNPHESFGIFNESNIISKAYYLIIINTYMYRVFKIYSEKIFFYLHIDKFLEIFSSHLSYTVSSLYSVW